MTFEEFERLLCEKTRITSVRPLGNEEGGNEEGFVLNFGNGMTLEVEWTRREGSARLYGSAVEFPEEVQLRADTSKHGKGEVI